MIARLLTGLKGPRVRRGLKLLPVLAALLLLPGVATRSEPGDANKRDWIERNRKSRRKRYWIIVAIERLSVRLSVLARGFARRFVG